MNEHADNDSDAETEAEDEETEWPRLGGGRLHTNRTSNSTPPKARDEGQGLSRYGEPRCRLTPRLHGNGSNQRLES